MKELWAKYDLPGWGAFEWTRSKLRAHPQASAIIGRYALVLENEFGQKMPAVPWQSVLENCVCNKEARFKHLLKKSDFVWPATQKKREWPASTMEAREKAKKLRAECMELERQITEQDAEKYGWKKRMEEDKAEKAKCEDESSGANESESVGKSVGKSPGPTKWSLYEEAKAECVEEDEIGMPITVAWCDESETDKGSKERRGRNCI